MRSVAGYNSIYRKEILLAYRYDDFIINADDIEINYRIARGGYRFIGTSRAFLYHREVDSFVEYIRNMYRYGLMIGNVIKKHRAIIRLYVPIALTFWMYTVSVPVLMVLAWWLGLPMYLLLVPYLFVLLVGIMITAGVYRETRSLWSIACIVLLPIHVFVYATGVLMNLSKRRQYFLR